jgi:hypothetical protein
MPDDDDIAKPPAEGHMDDARDHGTWRDNNNNNDDDHNDDHDDDDDDNSSVLVRAGAQDVTWKEEAATSSYSWVRAFPWLGGVVVSSSGLDRNGSLELFLSQDELNTRTLSNNHNGKDDDDDDDICWLEYAWSCARLSEHRGNFNGNDGFSRKRRTTRCAANDSNLGYGEILPRSIWTVLFQWLPLVDETVAGSGDNDTVPPSVPEKQLQPQNVCLVDLGSGSGRALLAASLGVMRQMMVMGKSPMHRPKLFLPRQHQQQHENDDDSSWSSYRHGHRHLRLIGIEVDPAWEGVAKRNYRELYFGCPFVEDDPPYPRRRRRDDDEDQEDDDRKRACSSVHVRLDASFVTADFTQWTTWTTSTSSSFCTITAADLDDDNRHRRMLVLCHATVFDRDLMEAMAETCALCMPGTWFLVVSRPLIHPEIETIHEGPLEMSWGLATVYLQRRR